MIRLEQGRGTPNFCFLIVDVRSNKDILIQSDFDYPGTARAFGWTGEDDQIHDAFKFLSENVGKTADDPGYFNDDLCSLCNKKLEKGNGDNWGDLCPECADRVSNYMDDHGIEDSDVALQHIRDEDESNADSTTTDLCSN